MASLLTVHAAQDSPHRGAFAVGHAASTRHEPKNAPKLVSRNAIHPGTTPACLVRPRARERPASPLPARSLVSDRGFSNYQPSTAPALDLLCPVVVRMSGFEWSWVPPESRDVRRRIGNRVQIPNGPATVNGERARTTATVSPRRRPPESGAARRMGRRGQVMIRESVDLPGFLVLALTDGSCLEMMAKSPALWAGDFFVCCVPALLCGCDMEEERMRDETVKSRSRRQAATGALGPPRWPRSLQLSWPYRRSGKSSCARPRVPPFVAAAPFRGGAANWSPSPAFSPGRPGHPGRGRWAAWSWPALAALRFAVAALHSRLLDRMLTPLVVVSQTIPVITLAPLLVLWFGYGAMPRVRASAPSWPSSPWRSPPSQGFRSTDPDLLLLLRSVDASRWDVFWRVRLPHAGPFLAAGVRTGATLSAWWGRWWPNGPEPGRGLGYIVLSANSRLATAQAFAAVLIICLLGLAAYGLRGPRWRGASVGGIARIPNQKGRY